MPDNEIQEKSKVILFVERSTSDWVAWCNKLKWNFISFKFLSFFGFCGLLILLWFGIERAFNKTVVIATSLHSSGHINEDHVTKIITNAQSVYYDSLIGHVSILAVGVLVAIVGLKALSDKIDGEITKSKKDLKKFLKK